MILGEVGPVTEVCNGTVSLGNKAQLFNHLSKFGCDIAYDHKYHHTHNQMHGFDNAQMTVSVGAT